VESYEDHSSSNRLWRGDPCCNDTMRLHVDVPVVVVIVVAISSLYLANNIKF